MIHRFGAEIGCVDPTMGLCLSRHHGSKRRRRMPTRIVSHSVDAGVGSYRWARMRSSSSRKEDILINERALAAAILVRRQLQDRSVSSRYTNASSKRNQASRRSSSSTVRSVTDPLVQPQRLVNQHIKLDNLETSHFVLVHGGGFGAWCWYKTIALLEEHGHKVTAVHLTGSGVHSFDTNHIASLSQYVKPLVDTLEELIDGEKVILVGHDFGGACISYAMELFPSKISKAIFLAATMLTNGQNALDIFSGQVEANDWMQRAQIFLYSNGKNKSPTAIAFKKSLLKDLLFNQSPAKDVALASVSMRPIPFSPILEKLTLSESNHGSVRRFYIEALEDNAIPIAVQKSMINKSPPEQVFSLKGADHSPFFSRPQALHKLLVEISRIP